MHLQTKREQLGKMKGQSIILNCLLEKPSRSKDLRPLVILTPEFLSKQKTTTKVFEKILFQILQFKRPVL